MKYLLSLFLSGCMIFSHAQHFTIGLRNGINFSDYRGHFTTGKWEHRPGALTGLFLKYDAGSVLSLETGLDYTTQSYHHIAYSHTQSDYGVYPANMIAPPSLSDEKWDVDFFRIPVLITLSTPTKLKFSVSAGFYLAVNSKQEYFSDGYPYIVYDQYINPVSYSEPGLPHFDNGFLYAASLSYPANEHLDISLSGRYITGHKPFFRPDEGRTGASEIALGIGYRLGKKKRYSDRDIPNDTIRSRFSINPIFGLSFSYLNTPGFSSGYKSRESFSAGFQLEYRLDPYVSLKAGLIFDRRGYRLDDSSSYFFRTSIQKNQPQYEVKTKVGLDYAVIPLILKFQTGRRVDGYLESGPYFGMLLNARTVGTAETEMSYPGSFIRHEINVYDDIEGVIKSMDFGWILGGGFQYSLPRGISLNIGLQCDFGLVNIFSEDGEDQNSGKDESMAFRNRSFRVSTGIIIPIKNNSGI